MILDLETFYFHMSPLLLSRSSELDSDEAEMELLDVLSKRSQGCYIFSKCSCSLPESKQEWRGRQMWELL